MRPVPAVAQPVAPPAALVGELSEDRADARDAAHEQPVPTQTPAPTLVNLSQAEEPAVPVPTIDKRSRRYRSEQVRAPAAASPSR